MRRNINRLIQHRSNHKKQFTQIDNLTIDCMPDTVRYPARWLFLILLRLPPNFNPSSKVLAKRMRCDDRTIRTYVAELKQSGFIETEEIAGQTIYHIYERPKRVGINEQPEEDIGKEP